jgi:tetratricopeptide (TPR) repeat protein
MTQKTSFLSRFTPSLMAPEALESIFVQRHDLAKQIIERIRSSAIDRSPQHTIMTGPRGIGKTHLLSLVYYRVRAMTDIRERLGLAWLREEEWEITSFLDFLIRLLHALAAEQEDDTSILPRINALYNLTPERAAVAAVDMLHDLVRGRTLLILAENLDELLHGMGEDGRRQLQRFLKNHPMFIMLASSQIPLNDYFELGNPMLPGKCHLQTLDELSHEESISLLAKIAAYRGDQQLATFLSTPRGLARMRALKYLAGGNHRAYVIFSHFITRDSLDDLIEPLMRTIDDLTPYYQARMAGLVPEQRKIIAFVCESRHPVAHREIARRCFMKMETAAAHLEALRKIGHLQSFTVGADRFYELREPLMRLSIEVKKHRGRPVHLLVDFLRLWYSPAELQQRLAALPADAILERAYALPALYATEEEGCHPRIPVCCAEYRRAVERNDYAHALQAAEELVSRRGRIEDYAAQGYCLRSLGRLEDALTCYDRMITLNPDDGQAWMIRSSVLSKLGRHQDALISCDKAIELNPQEARVWSNRGGILLNTGRPEEALTCFKKAIELDPEDAFGWISCGMALSELGCFKEASDSFARAAQLEPQNEMIYVYRSAALIELKQLDKALVNADRALDILPKQPLAWAVRGTALAALGRYQEALDSLQHAIELGETSSFVFFKRAEILLAEEKWRDGIVALDHTLGRFYRPGNPDAGNTAALVRLLQRVLSDDKGLQLRIKALLLLYHKHNALSALAHALVECIPELMTPLFQDHTARRWLEDWRTLAGPRPEFRLPLRLLSSAVSYRETQDLRVLMELPLEERILLEPLLGVKVQATA